MKRDRNLSVPPNAKWCAVTRVFADGGSVSYEQFSWAFGFMCRVFNFFGFWYVGDPPPSGTPYYFLDWVDEDGDLIDPPVNLHLRAVNWMRMKKLLRRDQQEKEALRQMREEALAARRNP